MKAGGGGIGAKEGPTSLSGAAAHQQRVNEVEKNARRFVVALENGSAVANLLQGEEILWKKSKRVTRCTCTCFQ